MNKTEKKTAQYEAVRVPGTGTYHTKDSFDNNKLEAGPAAKGHNNKGQMRRSHASLALTSAPPSQRINCRHTSNSSRLYHEETNRISYFGEPQTTEVNKNKEKNRPKSNAFYQSYEYAS